MLKLYSNIRYYRKLRGMTQEQLALKIGYSNRSTVARIEKGDFDLSQSKIIAIAEALNVTPGELMGTDGTQTTKKVYYHVTEKTKKKDEEKMAQIRLL